MTLTLKDIYNETAGQAWSMFDGEVENEDEFESSLTSSIQKALADLWCKYPYPFRIKDYPLITIANIGNYDTPNGNIIEKKVNNKQVYSIKLGNNFLNYLDDNENLEEKTGVPTDFYIKNDKINLYPTPDSEYLIDIEYLTLVIGKNSNNEDIFTLKNDADIINISSKYEELFKKALITLSMHYAIASSSNQNYSSYQSQAESAYKRLVKCTKGIEKSSRIGWR